MSDGRDPHDGDAGRYDAADSAPRRRAEAARLREELRALGRSLDAPGGAGPESMAERVLAQILAEQAPVPVPVAEPPGVRERLRSVRSWAQARWRSLTAALCGLLTVLALTPPVRAAVADWLDFGGVEVRYDPSAVPTPGAEVPGCGQPVSLAQAERRAGFAPLVPEGLGTPDAVTVSSQPHGRFLISLCWSEQGRNTAGRVPGAPGRQLRQARARAAGVGDAAGRARERRGDGLGPVVPAAAFAQLLAGRGRR